MAAAPESGPSGHNPTAQERLLLRRDAFPEFMWRDSQTVALDALRAALPGNAVSSFNALLARTALLGRHLPRRPLLPIVARATSRFADA